MKGITLLKGKAPILQKIVFELRYRGGYSYLDRCGRTINAIIGDSLGWIADPGNPNPQSASLVNLANSSVLNIGTKKLDLSLEIPLGGESLDTEDVTNFSGQADHATAIVIDQLGLDDFERIGCRLWYIFPCESQEESESWLASLRCYSVNPEFVDSFGGTQEALGVAVVITGSDRTYRVAFNGVQRTAMVDLGKGILNVRVRDLGSEQQQMLKKQEKIKARVRRSPEYPAMIDVDAYIENPEISSVGQFITSTHSEAMNRLSAAVGGSDK